MVRTRALDPISRGANLRTQTYQAKTALPNEHDVNAQFFGDIAKSLGDKPRGWRALASGLAKGAEYGSKTRSIGKRQEEADKYERVMDYLVQANDYAVEVDQWHKKKEMAQQQFLPQVVSYAENIDKLDPQSQRIMAQNILDGYSRTTGEDLKLVSIDGSDPFVVTVQTEKGPQILDVRTLFAGDELLQQKMAMKMPEYQMKLQQERQDKKREFELKEKDLQGKYGSKLSYNQEENIDEQGNNYVSLDKLEKSARTEFQKQVMKEQRNIPIYENSINTINDMRQIFEKYPDIANKLVNILESDDDGTFSNLLKRWTLSTEELAAVEKLRKSAADLNLSTILGVPGKSATDLLKREIKNAAPNGKLTKKGFDSIAAKWEERAKQNIQLAENMFDDLQNNRITRRSKKAEQSNSQDDWSDIGTPIQ
jgi:hypothetical protein